LLNRRGPELTGLLHDIASLPAPQRVPWDLPTRWTLFSLVGIWAALFALTWAHWGDLTVDCGREMYVATELASGRTLYSDVWYPYTPGSPYLNSILFRIFGVQLSTLYWAGSLAALGSAVFLFLAGLHLVPRVAAWTVGTVLLIQSFVPSLFSFPLPYSFGAVYGCFSACLFLWLIVNACSSFRAGWMLGAGVTASVALLMKPEFGVGCFAALGFLVIIRAIKQSSFQRAAIDLATLLPGCLLCVAVIYWMISLRGAEFLTQENLVGWPTSSFMKKYGTFWLSGTGLEISRNALLLRGFALVSILTVSWLAFRWILLRYGHRRSLFWVGLLALTALLVLGQQWAFLERGARVLAFPPAAPFLAIVMLPVAAWLWWRSRLTTGFMQALILIFFVCCLSIRILFRMTASGHAIYYDGPAILSYFLFLNWLLSWKAPNLMSTNRSVALLPYLATLVAVILNVLPFYKLNPGSTSLATDRGVIYTSSQKAGAYRSTLDFIQQHRQPDASFLSVPEDMSLYFLAGIHCPTRLYQFGPADLATGKMTADFIREIERKKVRYLIWSNRTFEEYGIPNFGVDFHQALGEYFTAAYRPIRTIGGEASGGWKAVVWERISDAQSRALPATAASTRGTPAR
jgi:hypothetical protein